MASVAICPHCYLQLAIPDHASRDAQVECPSCHTEFGLEKATLRAIPQGVLKEPVTSAASEEIVSEEIAPDVIPLSARKPTAAAPRAETKSRAETAEPLAETAEHADADIAAWFRSNKTVPDVVPIVGNAGIVSDEAAEDDDSNVEDDAVTNAEDPTPMDESVAAIDERAHDLPPTPKSNVTLADWQALRPDAITRGTDRPMQFTPEPPQPAAASDDSIEMEIEQEAIDADVPGPSFDLPNVPLTRGTGATVEFGSDQFDEATAGADFELDDVDLDSPDHRWMKDEFNAADEALEPAHDPNARTMEDVGLLDGRLRDASYEESLRSDAEESAAEHYEHSTSLASEDHGGRAHDLPTALPPQHGRRKRSALRMMVGAVTAAPVGLAIGYFALLWIKGPQADFLQMAKYIPPNFLPASFSSAAPRDETAVAPRPETVAETIPEPPATKDSENIPASYVTPVKPAAEQPPSGGSDRYAAQSSTATAKPDDVTPIGDAPHDEPRRFAAPAAGPLTGDDVHIMGAPLFTVTEFAATLAKAQKAEPGLVAGDLSDPAVRKIKGFNYKELCDLAQIVTFCEDSSAADRLTQMQHDADELFQRILSVAQTRDEVAQIANIWIDSTYRKHGGIFLAGSIHGGEIAGDVYEYQLSTEAGRELRLLLLRPLDMHVAAAGHPVGIVGSIVDEPAHKITGYTGASPRVIWVHDVIPLD